MNNCMFTKQDHFTRRTDEPLSVFLSSQLWARIEGQLLHSTADIVDLASEDVSFLLIGGKSDGACFEESTLKVVEEVGRVFYADAETDEIFWEATSSTSGWINGSVSKIKISYLP